MGLNNNGTEEALNHLASLIGYVSIHSEDPGSTGVNEISTRQPVTWKSASGTNLDNDGDIEFSVEAGSSVHSVGLWSLSTGGVFYGSRALPSPVTFSNQGKLTISDLDINIVAD